MELLIKKLIIKSNIGIDKTKFKRPRQAVYPKFFFSKCSTARRQHNKQTRSTTKIMGKEKKAN